MGYLKWLTKIKMPPAFEMIIGGGAFTIIAMLVGLVSAMWGGLMGIVAVLFIAHGLYRGIGHLKAIRDVKEWD